MSKRLAILSDSCFFSTGYANIAKQIATRLARDHGWEVTYIANGYQGRNWGRDEIKGYPFKIYGQGREPYCKDVIPIVLQKEKPQVYLTLLDTFMLFNWYFFMDFAPARSVFYYPSDGGGGLPRHCENILKRMSLPVAMAKFGQRQAKELYNIDSVYIPHACDENHYKRWSDEQRAVLRAQWGLTGKYVVGVVARNQGRKVLDKTIKIFKDFCKDKPEAVLLIHADPVDPAAVFDLQGLIDIYGLQNRVLYTGTTWYEGFPYDRMPEVYNLMDVFLLTTSGEGFGIPIIEAMATEVPVIATSYTTTHELVEQNNAGLGIKLSGSELVDFFELHPRDYDWKLVNGTVTGSWNVERGFCDITHGVELMNRLYNNPAERKQLGLNGRAAVLREYTWVECAKRWDAVLTSLVQW